MNVELSPFTYLPPDLHSIKVVVCNLPHSRLLYPLRPLCFLWRHVTWFELHELSVSRVHLMSGQELRIQYERNNSYTADVHRGLRPQIYP
jgi:hypothetical protein